LRRSPPTAIRTSATTRRIFVAWLSVAATAEFNQLRANALGPVPDDAPSAVSPDVWYEAATRRIDGMRLIESSLAADLEQLCSQKLVGAKAGAKRESYDWEVLNQSARVAILLTTLEPAAEGQEAAGGVALYNMEDGLPKPMRLILNVVDAQSRRINEINSQLEAVRGALAERKIIERAKGILMRSQRLPEKDAYTLLRQAAMSQNKRIIQVAEAVISMADILRT
jgi:hypothetical protein